MSTVSPVAPVRNTASAAEVRTFLLEQGINVGSRGKFSAEQIATFNKQKGKKYVQGVRPDQNVQTVTGRNAAGKKVTKNVSVPRARKVLAEQGVEVGKRGRLSVSLLLQAAGLSPLA